MKLSPFLKCICPACFEEIYLGECRIISSTTSGNILKDPGKGLFARAHVVPLNGSYYAQELAQRECPECTYLLPYNIEQVPNLIFVVVGDVSSGKSHYIISMIQQIKQDWMANASGFASFTCLTSKREQDYIKEYFNPLYGHNQSLAATQPRDPIDPQHPLIYHLITAPSLHHPPIEANLMIYDASGEDFEQLNRLVQVARFTLISNAFIFVVDPFTILPLIQELDPQIQYALDEQIQSAQGRRAADRLNFVIRMVERYRGVPLGSSFRDTPIAVMISKSDIFEAANPTRSFHFKTSPAYGDGVDLRDIDLIDQEVQDLLREYNQGDLLAATYRFKKLKYFATSATGTPPNIGGKLTYVKPRRCLDPMLCNM